MEAEPVPRTEESPSPLELRLLAELPAVRTLLRRLVGPHREPDQEDLMQEVVAKAWAARDRFDPARPLGPWLRTIAFRTFLDWRERRRRVPAALPIDGAVSPESAQGAQSAVDAREQVDLLLSRLDPEARCVLECFYLTGMSVAEVADHLGMAPGTVKSHLHRGRRRLAAPFSATDESR